MIHIHVDAVAYFDPTILYENVLAQGTLDFSSETADGFAANALGPQTYDFWTPSALPATLGTTLVAAQACDACAIVAHTLGSSGATIFVEYFDGVWVEAYSVTPTDDTDLMLIFVEASSTQWRIRITGATTPHIGIAIIGKRFFLPEGVLGDYTPINLALDIELATSITVKGQYVGTFVKNKGASADIPLPLQERTWIEGAARPFIAHYNYGQPFIWASCPGLLADDISYCWRAGDTLRVSYRAGLELGDVSMKVEAYVGS